MSDPSAPAEGRTGGQAGPPRLWDPIVRLTHWGVAALVLANAIFVDGGSVVHVWLGWIGLGLLVLRGLWGLAGPVEARFSSFPPRPRAALSHLAALRRGHPPRHPSHNPAGAIMIWTFWALLLFIIGSGILMTGTGPQGYALRQEAAEAGDWDYVAAHPPPLPRSIQKVVKELHEIAANLVLVLAVVHIAGVLVESRRMRVDLLSPMVAGRRRDRDG